ncbi:MAG: hypothetical protein HC780_11765 [Leptolyngbyaceae cyanobacterium CSU_1_3]|nr:hypothetical protein [Leptolyngbyaceae cyanobacterium CSU_1_3]
MPFLRFLLLLAIAGVLLLFVLPNWAPSMQLVFLGLRSPTFPLSLWIWGRSPLALSPLCSSLDCSG